VEELIEQQQAEEAEKKQEARKAAKGGAEIKGPLPEAASSRARLLAQEANKAELDPARVKLSAGADAQAAQAASPLESFTTVFGSSNGATLRAIAKDLDSTEMLLKLASPAGRPMRRMAVQKISGTLTRGVKEGVRSFFKGKGFTSREFMNKFDGAVVPSRRAEPEAASPKAWPSSEKASRLAKIKSARANQAGLLLLRIHVNRQVAAGWRGAAAVCGLFYVMLRVGVAAIIRTIIHSVGLALTKLLPNKLAVATAAGAAAVIGWVGAELSALGGSVTNTAEEIEMKKLQLLEKAEAKAKAKAAGATDEGGRDEANATA